MDNTMYKSPGVDAAHPHSQDYGGAQYRRRLSYRNRVVGFLGLSATLLSALLTVCTPSHGFSQVLHHGEQRWNRLLDEPDISKVLRAAKEHIKMSPLAQIASRSHWYAALPKRVSLRLQKHHEDGWRGTLYDDSGWSHRSLKDARLGWRVEAEWALSELVYNSHQLAIANVQNKIQRLRREYLDEVTRLYFERRKQQLLYLSKRSSSSIERSQTWVQIQAMTARLDRMTGGLVTRKAVPWWEPKKP